MVVRKVAGEKFTFKILKHGIVISYLRDLDFMTRRVRHLS